MLYIDEHFLGIFRPLNYQLWNTIELSGTMWKNNIPTIYHCPLIFEGLVRITGITHTQLTQILAVNVFSWKLHRCSIYIYEYKYSVMSFHYEHFRKIWRRTHLLVAKHTMFCDTVLCVYLTFHPSRKAAIYPFWRQECVGVGPQRPPCRRCEYGCGWARRASPGCAWSG